MLLKLDEQSLAINIIPVKIQPFCKKAKPRQAHQFETAAIKRCFAAAAANWASADQQVDWLWTPLSKIERLTDRRLHE